VGRLPPWQSRTGIGGASSETAVVARVNTTYWGLLKQPDNQKLSSDPFLIEKVGDIVGLYLNPLPITR
ncbi:MAG: hypothetical protein WCF26_09930, partial [Candidatus Sulfotelmatobacter sp.]